MKSRKRTWIAALCLLSVTVITISLKARSGSVLAAQHPASQLSIAPPATYISNPSIRAAAIADATLMAGDESSAQHVAAALMPEANPYLPAVEEFALTPPNPALDINQTTLAVRFQESVVAKLGSQIPMTLGGQRVVLRRSADDKTVFSTQVDFDWAAFVKQQQHRKELASLGTVVPVYKGRIFVGKREDAIPRSGKDRGRRAIAPNRSILAPNSGWGRPCHRGAKPRTDDHRPPRGGGRKPRKPGRRTIRTYLRRLSQRSGQSRGGLDV